MNTPHSLRSSFVYAGVVFAVLAECAMSQTYDATRATMSQQADYVIIAPSRYVQTMQPLAAFRQATNGFTVSITSVEDIYDSFGHDIAPDSAIRSFITFTLTGGWTEPRPKYFLLAGNTDAVPTHREAGVFSFEDSVSIDQWFVEGPADTTFPRPAAAIGRFPARDSLGLANMVSKTIAYENAAASPWFGRTLIAADYAEDFGSMFELEGWALQKILSSVWSDSTTVHVRESSTQYGGTQRFRELWDEGAAIVSLLGLADWMHFSRSFYFSTWDVDSLTDNTPLAFCTLDADQRFDRTATPAIAVALLEAPTKGAVATLAPTGLMFASEKSRFLRMFFEGLADNPRQPIGMGIMAVKRTPLGALPGIRRETLLGDPAVVIKSPRIAGIGSPPPTLPDHVVLQQNYPNPFNPSTTIALSLPRRSAISLAILDVFGREMEVLYDGELPAGEYHWRWNGGNATSGVFYYRVRCGDYAETRRMLLLK